MLGSPITPHNKARMNAAELDADLWLDRARDLCGHREALVDQLKSLGTQLQTANPDEAASLRPKSHALLRELREAACHVCEAAQQYRDACRNPDAPLAYKDEDYLAKMAHDLDFMGESEALVAAIGTPRRLLRNNPLMLPRPLRAAELDAEDAPPKNAEQARLRRAEALLVGASIAHRNPKAPSSLDMMIEDQGSSLDALSPQPEEEEEEEEVVSRTPPKPATPKPQFANQPSNVNDDWVREAHAQLKELREAQAQLPLERGDPELAAMNNNPALERFKPVLEGKKRAPPRQKKLVELSTEGAYADPDARSYVAPPPRKAKKHQNRHRAQIVDKLERLQRSEGPLLPQIKMGGPPPGLKKMRKKKGRPLQGVTLARAELSAIDLTADDLEDIASLDEAPNEAARRVGACALTLMCRGDRCPPDASWNAVIRAFDDDPDGMLRAIRAVDAKSDVPPFKARALSRLLASGGLDATATFEHIDSEAGDALGRLAAWCSRCVRAALRAAERASDDESSVPQRRGRRRAARDDDSYQSDLSSLNTTPRGMIKRRARRRKKKVVPPPPVIPHRPKEEASFKNGRVMMASWWRFEAASTACLVSVVAPSSAKGNSHALLVKAYDPTRGDGESVLVLDAATVDRLRNHETLENFVRTQGLLRKLELRVSAHGAAKLRERAGPPTGAPAAPPGGGPRVSGGLRKRQAASAPVVEKEAVDAVPPRAIETAPPAKPASAKARFAERQRAAEEQKLAQEREEKARLAQARLEKAARAEAKRRLAAERAAEDARRAKAATALQSRARGRSATARTKEAFAAVVRVQAAWRCRVGAQALGVAKSSAVALQSALRGKSGREAARRKRAAKEQAKRDAERRRREAERRAAEARRLEAEEAERKRQAFEAKQRAAAEEQRRAAEERRRAEDYAAAKAREAAALSARRREREAAEARARAEAEAEAARRRDEAAALARAPSASASELASESDDGYGDDDFDEFSPAKTTGPPSPAQRRAPAVPPVPLDPSSSDDGYGDSDFDDFDDE